MCQHLNCGHLAAWLVLISLGSCLTAFGFCGLLWLERFSRHKLLGILALGIISYAGGIIFILKFGL